MKCECSATNDEINIESPDKFDENLILEGFYDSLKYSNFKVIKCFKLVFNFGLLKNNYGSLIAFLYFLIYLIFVIIYCFRGISSLKKDIFNLYSKNQNNKHNHIVPSVSSKIYTKKRANNKGSTIKIKNIINSSKNIKDIKRKSKKSKTIKLERNGKSKTTHIIKMKRRNKTNEINKKANPVKRLKRKKYLTQKIVNKYDITNSDNNQKNSKNNHINYDKSDSKSIINENRNSKGLIRQNTHKLSKLTSKKNVSNSITNQKLLKDKKNEEKLSDFELNELEYYEAIDIDKRRFYQMYWGLIRREHLILFTFFSWHDYNIINVKLAKFIFLVCQDMAFNVFFFSDDSMHKIYISYGKYDFLQQIPQIIYSTIASNIIEVFLCFLCMTDRYFYQIKKIKNKKNKNDTIFQILKSIKCKLIVFFCFTFTFFAIYWYIISSFCAVYPNTQMAFLKDSASSLLTNMILPFILYLFPSILRIIALKDKARKRLGCIYKLSDIIPFF